MTEEDKIDLDGILEHIPESYYEDSVSTIEGTHKFMAISVKGAKQLAKEAVRLALILASKKAKTKKDAFLNYYVVIDRQSILDVNDLVV